MNDGLHPDMLEATRLTRAGRITEATALLQRVLRGGTVPELDPLRPARPRMRLPDAARASST